MPKRISVDIEGFEQKLEKLADLNDRKVAQEARNILKEGVEDRFSELADIQDHSPSGQFLKSLAQKKPPKNGELIKLSHLLNIPVEVLVAIRDSYLAEVSEDVENSQS